jgi:hypothetical protein
VPKSWVKEAGAKRTSHPREGIAPHGRADKRPEGGGEYFRPRGIGKDYVDCFVCTESHKHHELNANIAAFVQCKESGERIVAMFERGAWLDYREREPDRIQVKVGACDEHRACLEALARAVEESGVLKMGDIIRARAGKAMVGGKVEP